MPAVLERQTPSIYLQAKQLVYDACVALRLEGIGTKEIAIRGGPWNKTQIYRGLTIWGNKVAPGAQASNYRNHFGYACVLSLIMLDENSAGGGAANDRLPMWKTVLFNRFDNQQLPGLSFPGATHLSCTVQDSSLRIPANHPAGGDRYAGDQLIVWYWVRVPTDDGE